MKKAIKEICNKAVNEERKQTRKLKEDDIFQMLRELNQYCFVCKKSLFLLCGQPKVVVGGCCVGSKLRKTRWIHPINAHLSCYLKYCRLPEKEEKKIKLLLPEKQLKGLLIPHIKKRLKASKRTLKEDFCKKDKEFTEEVQKDIAKFERWLGYLEEPVGKASSS